MGLINKWSQCLINKQCLQLTIQYLSNSPANKTCDKQSIKDRTLAVSSWGANRTSDKHSIKERILAASSWGVGELTKLLINTLLKIEYWLGAAGELTKLLINTLLKIEHWLGSTQTPTRKQFLNCTWTHSDDTWSVIVSIQQCRYVVCPTHSYSIQHTEALDN